ncbi:MAG: ribonuclease III [Parcubacteria group bacterium]|nr:ribonuclease III [Parcubacteria group bacterium]
MDVSRLEFKIGVVFKNKNLLLEAITHRSYLNENSQWGTPHNERLEFLGDAVLELVVTEHLFNSYPAEPEGYLTSLRAALVNYVTLAKTAGDIGLQDFILMSRGEMKDTGRAREVILANAIEALIGAVYLDGGFEEAAKIIERFLLPRLPEIVEQRLYRDPKSRLQEIAQEKKKVTPVYKLLEEWGPDHKKIFKMGVYFGEELVAQGEGYSKQDAEVEAAKSAIKARNWE